MKQIRRWRIETLTVEGFESLQIMIKDLLYLITIDLSYFIAVSLSHKDLLHFITIDLSHENLLYLMIKGLLSNSWFWMFQHLQQLISQCVIDEFASFLRHWISLIKLYNMTYLNIYHIAVLVCVFEVFNCMSQIENWWLNSENSSFGTRFWL